jgi:NAD(P)-dependent dehydrogenase (short-subunit alcohol dehydrogenase family)
MAEKVVLITGVAHGCGRVLAESFAAEGARVVGCDLGRPKELVAAVRYVLSDDTRFVTGTSLVLDGGYTAV